MKRDLGQEAGLMEGEGMEQNFPFLEFPPLPPQAPHFSGLYQYWGEEYCHPRPHWNLWELVPEPGVPHFLLLLYDTEVWDLAGNSIPVSLEGGFSITRHNAMGVTLPQS